MANPSVRLIVAVILGTLTGGLLVWLVEGIGFTLFPPPAEIDMTDRAAMKDMIARLPAGALMMVLLGWFLGSLAGATLANRIARTARAGWIVALIFIALTAYTFVIIPHPAWMMAAGVALPLLSASIAARLSGRLKSDARTR